MNDEIAARLIPVLDLKHGHVVRGVGGRRDEYLPIVSRWTASSAPLDVATAISRQFGFRRFYVADLGAIERREPHWAAVDSLLSAGFQLDVDAGIRNVSDCEPWKERQGVRIVLGLESIGPASGLGSLVAACGPADVVFSLDLMHGRPLTGARWPATPLEIAAVAVEAGVERLIVLDLAAVGGEEGCPTLPLCRALRARWPGITLITGGGIRSEEDVVRAVDAGVDQVLVASALHDGRIF